VLCVVLLTSEPEIGGTYLKTKKGDVVWKARSSKKMDIELELELIQTQMTQKPMLRAEVGMRVRCAQVKIVKRIVCRGQEA
jgi:hypothetical protein